MWCLWNKVKLVKSIKKKTVKLEGNKQASSQKSFVVKRCVLRPGKLNGFLVA